MMTDKDRNDLRLGIGLLVFIFIGFIGGVYLVYDAIEEGPTAWPAPFLKLCFGVLLCTAAVLLWTALTRSDKKPAAKKE